MAYRMRRGMRGVLTAGTADPCALSQGGLFNKACWCWMFPALCTTAEYQATVGLMYPEETYAPIQTPPVVGAPTGAALTVPPASGQQAAQTIDELLAQQETAWQAQNAATMAETQRNLDAIAAGKDGDGSPTPSPTNWWLWIGVAAVGVFALATLGGGSPRRYGR